MTPTRWASWAQPALAPRNMLGSLTGWISTPVLLAKPLVELPAVTSQDAVKSWQSLRQKARPYLFSNSLAPSIVAATIKALELVVDSGELREKLFENARHFRRRMSEEGFELLDGEHAIIPVMFGDAIKAADVAAKMLERGVFVTAFSYPVVPKGAARIRVQLSAAHSAQDIEACVQAFIASR